MGFPIYDNCKIEIKEGEIRFAPPLGNPVSGPLNKDLAVHQTIRRFRDHWIKKFDRDCARDDFVTLGLNLYWVLFPPDSAARDAFESMCRQFLLNIKQNRNRRLRVQLIFHEDTEEELTDYPWEFLYVPLKPGSFFLAGEKTDLILTRFVPELESELERRMPRELEETPVRIVLVTSQPKYLEKLDLGTIVDSIKDLNRRAKFDVTHVANPHYNQLKAIIDDVEPHVFHFIGHGEPGELALLRKPGEEEWEAGNINDVKWCTANDLAGLFSDNPPSLVFLHACNGATPKSTGLKSMARALVDTSVPAVVAMQYKIENRHAEKFADTFYRRLSAGTSIAEAVNAGRRALGEQKIDDHEVWGNRSFGTPVVYLQRDMSIVKVAAAESDEDEGATFCPKCGEGGLGPEDNFCRSCGHDLHTLRAQRCRKCRTVVPPDSQFCPRCGTRWQSAATVSERATRPTASVVEETDEGTAPQPSTDYTQFDLPATRRKDNGNRTAHLDK